MAIYRLHKRAWDASLPVVHVKAKALAPSAKGGRDVGDGDGTLLSKRKRSQESFLGGGRRGISSGLSTVRGRGDAAQDKAHTQDGVRPLGSEAKWWQSLGEQSGAGPKGRVRRS
jgi:hypothetical protein